MRILFVCMGNICRSPAAECVFVDRLAGAGLDGEIFVDSAGTTAFHTGEPPDPRMQKALQSRNYQVRGRARPVTAEDYRKFDLILAMDRANLRDLEARRPVDASATIKLFGAYCGKTPGAEVPDPYYGGEAGFARVMDMLEDGSDALLAEIQQSRPPRPS